MPELLITETMERADYAPDTQRERTNEGPDGLDKLAAALRVHADWLEKVAEKARALCDVPPGYDRYGYGITIKNRGSTAFISVTAREKTDA